MNPSWNRLARITSHLITLYINTSHCTKPLTTSHRVASNHALSQPNPPPHHLTDAQAARLETGQPRLHALAALAHLCDRPRAGGGFYALRSSGLRLAPLLLELARWAGPEARVAALGLLARLYLGCGAGEGGGEGAGEGVEGEGEGEAMRFAGDPSSQLVPLLLRLLDRCVCVCICVCVCVTL